MEKTFEQWMAQVNATIGAMTGLDADDLPDVCYMDMFEEGTSVKQAAREAIRNAQD